MTWKYEVRDVNCRNNVGLVMMNNSANILKFELRPRDISRIGTRMRLRMELLLH